MFKHMLKDEHVQTATPRGMSRRLYAALMLLFVAALWGTTFPLVKEATVAFPVLAFLALRFLVACATLLPIIIRAKLPIRRVHIVWGLIGGVALGFGYVFQTFALRLADSGRVGFITGLYVVLVPIMGLLLFRTPLTRRVIFGGFLALAGLMLLGYAPGGNFAGDFTAFLCAVSFAGQILIVERFPGDSDPRFMVLLQSFVTMIMAVMLIPPLAAIVGCDSAICTALAPFADPLPTALPVITIAAVLFTGVIVTAFALTVQAWAQTILPSTEAAIIFAMESPFAMLFGIMFRNEILTFGGAVGCALIFAGMIVTLVPIRFRARFSARTSAKT
jgi:drug/metabolite transporter (DMT)-like permease